MSTMETWPWINIIDLWSDQFLNNNLMFCFPIRKMCLDRIKLSTMVTGGHRINDFPWGQQLQIFNFVV